jgi:transposase
MGTHAIIVRNAPQWMVALATTHDGDVPLFLQPLNGNSSDKVSLLSVITTMQAPLREARV